MIGRRRGIGFAILITISTLYYLYNPQHSDTISEVILEQPQAELRPPSNPLQAAVKQAPPEEKLPFDIHQAAVDSWNVAPRADTSSLVCENTCDIASLKYSFRDNTLYGCGGLFEHPLRSSHTVPTEVISYTWIAFVGDSLIRSPVEFDLYLHNWNSHS